MNLCTYCGTIATERDHLKPRTYRRHEFAFGQVKIDYSHIKTVPCCDECNRRLRGCRFTSVRDRAKFLASKYARLKIDQERLKWVRAVAFLDQDD